MPSWKLVNPPYQYNFKAAEADATLVTPGNDGTPQQQQPREEIILTGIDNDIYSTDGESLDSYYSRSQASTRNRGEAIANYPPPTYDQEPKVVADDEASSKEKEINNLMALISISNRGTGYDRQTGKYDNKRAVNVVGARENV
ncbi:hypothetical protein Tco_0826660, partial [Tanacetum coccineum]